MIVPERRELHRAHPSRRLCSGASSPDDQVASARVDVMAARTGHTLRALSLRVDPQALLIISLIIISLTIVAK